MGQPEVRLEDIVRPGAGAGRRGWLGWAAIAALAALLAAGLWAITREGEAARPETVPAERRDLVVTVAATGTVEPTVLVDVSSELSGTIREVLVDFNSAVRAGDVLARLDTDALEAARDHARASLAMREARVTEAEATLREAKAALDRATALAERGVMADQGLIAARASHERARAALDSARADLRVAAADLRVSETNLEKACICAPIDGIVLNVDAETGQTVAASLQAPVLFTIAQDLRRMELRVDIDEADIGSVALGDRASFTVDAWRGQSFPATIAALRMAPETVEGVVTYKAILDVDNAQRLLRPGMTATAEIVVEHLQDVLAVPNAALRFAPPPPEAAAPDEGSGLLGLVFRGPERTVFAPVPVAADGTRPLWVMRGSEMVQIGVRPGATDGRFTQIVSGDLAPGEAVIIGLEGP